MKPKVLIGATIPAHAVQEHWMHWCENAEQINAHDNYESHWCAVLQYDDRGRALFDPLVERLNELKATIYWFALDMGNTEWTTLTRLTGIVTGRNLIIDIALRSNTDYIYFADSDISAPDDTIVRLLELDHPVTGAHVPTYCLDGPQAPTDSDTRSHWNTAGSLLVHRSIFSRVPWRFDIRGDEYVTDDPATQAEYRALGAPTWVRHDVVATHNPPNVMPFEQRGIDRTNYTRSEIPTHVIIPYRDTQDHVKALIDQLGDAHIHVFDNSDIQQPHIPNVTNYWRPNSSIYELWNEGWNSVLEIDPIANLAILNDDIALTPDVLTHLATHLRSDDDLWLVYPDYNHTNTIAYTKGTYRHGGMCGWAFMVKAEARTQGLPPIDTTFKWWCGDDDLAFNIEQQGKRQAAVPNVQVEHIGQHTVNSHPELMAQTNADLAYCNTKWGR